VCSVGIPESSVNVEQARALTARLAERIATNSGDEAPSMLTEDVLDFLSPERAEREMRRFFRETPQVVGFAGELAEPRSWLTAEIAGVPMLVTRDADGGLHAMLNACAHRGARVATDRGTGRRFTCRSHGWTYDACGVLIARPRAECFDPPDERTRLTRLPVSDRSGLIVVGLDPAMSQSVVDEHLADIELELAGFDFRAVRALGTHRFEVEANWKLVAALSYESYHFATLHRDTVATWFAPNAVHDFFGRHSRWAFARRGTEHLLSQDRAKWPESVPGVLSHALFPGSVLIVTPDDAQIIRGEPGPTPGTSVAWLIGAYRVPEKLEESRAAFEFGLRAFQTEDLPAAEQSQRGLAAGRQTLLIGRNEPVVQFWHRQWREALGD
jgi:phenylpropionate dioxygenase-like ring-hydroxylating dioxygenase large terminal subunit